MSKKHTRFIAALLILGVSICLPLLWHGRGAHAATNTDSLVGYYKFDEGTSGANAGDWSEDGNTGVPGGDSGFYPVPDGGDTASTTFNNSHSWVFDHNLREHVDVAHNAEMDSMDAVTITGWVKVTGGGDMIFAQKYDYGDPANGFSLEDFSGNISCIGAGATAATTSVSAIDDNSWHHVACTLDSAHSTLYVDGTQVDQQTNSDLQLNNTSTLVFGGRSNGDDSSWFDGKMDDFRIYNRALGASEISDLAAGLHTTATWTGAVSSDYENGGNWDIGAIPDPYTKVDIANTGHKPKATADMKMANLTIETGARFDVDAYALTLNDNGGFNNDGTLIDDNYYPLNNFSNDTDSGTVMIKALSDSAGFGTGNTYNNLVINDGLRGYWKLDEQSGTAVADSSGYGNNGVSATTVTPDSSIPPSKFANTGSLTFGSANEVIDAGNDDTLAMHDSQWTVSAWVKTTNATGSIMTTFDGSSSMGHSGFGIAVSGGKAVIGVVDDNTVTYFAVSSESVDDGQWHLVTAVRTATNMEIYVDDGSANVGSFITTADIGMSSHFLIGQGFAGEGVPQYFDGNIDDVRVYDRALDDTEIGSLFDGSPSVSLHTVALSGNLTVNGNLTLASGTLDASSGDNYNVNLAGNLNADGGVFNAQNDTVNLTGNDQSITGSTSFYNLTKSVSAAHTLTFCQGSITTVGNTLSLHGASGNLLSLRSSADGTEWKIDPQDTRDLSYLDVKDANNINVTPIDTAGLHITDSGNNTGWIWNVAPDTPSSLGGTSYVDGSFGNDTTPTLSFTLSDADVDNQVKYQIQIDDTSDFSSPVVDYASALGSQGSKSFTVGQAAGSGTYTTGSSSTTLSDGSYYWRVRATDDYSTPLTSSYATANSGSIAFKVDATAPSTPGTPSTTTPTTDTTPTWTWSASSDGGAGLKNPAYTVQWSTHSDFSSGNSSATTNSTSFTHGTDLADGTWYFRVKASDSVNNDSSYSSNGTVVVDTTAPTGLGTPSATSPTADTTPTWSWTAASDSGSGLAATPYSVQWSTHSDFSSGNSTDTSATNSFTHSTPLAEGTWYFRVKAVDVLGNETSYSSNGSVVIDTTAPDDPGTPNTTSPTTDNTPSWSWSASSDSGSGLKNPAYSVQWSQASDFGSGVNNATTNSASFTHGSGLADGTWYFRVKATDAAGNDSSYSSNGSVVVDTAAPSTPGTPSTTSPTADVTPTWTWTASSDGSGVGLAGTPYTVQWSQDSGFGSGVSSDTSATNSFTHTADLAEGTWYFRVKAKDSLNNASGFSSNGSVVIDTTAPDNPGTPSTTSPTTDTTPTWSWSASSDGGAGLANPAYTVQWSTHSDFSTGNSSATTNSTSFTHSTPLADSTWYFRVKAVDAVGNETSYSSNGSVVVDTTAPSTPGTPSTTTPTADTTPMWSWSASTDGGSGLAGTPYTIEWSQDNTFLTGVSNATVSGTTYTHTVDLDEGTWYARVKAKDAVNNESSFSSAGSVLIDVSAPSTPGTPSTTSPTASKRPAWTWTASSDGGSGLAGTPYTVEWSTHSDFSSGVSSATTATNSYTHSSDLSDGTWYFRVKAKDAVNNTSAYSSNGSVLVDATAPDDPGTPSTTSPTADSTPSWTWTASADSGAGLANPAYTVEWSTESDFSSGVETDTTNTNSFTHVDDLADGTWYFRVKAADAVGNESAYSSNGSVLVDTTSPSDPGTPSTTTPTADTTPSWSWAASTDAGADLANPAYTVEWSTHSDFSSGVSTDTTNSASFTHSTPLANGTWYFRVKAADAVGNESGYSSNGSVLVDTAAPSTPGTPSTTSPTTNKKPAWSWTASSDGGAGLANPAYTLEWSQSATFASGVSSDTVNTNAYTQPSNLADGTWYFHVKAKDVVNNESAFSTAGSVLIDTTAPSVPGTPSTTTPTTDTTPSWSWTASSDSGGSGLANPAYTVQWSQSATFASGVTTNTVNTNAYTQPTDLADGLWYFHVKATDVLSNASAYSTAGSVLVDTTAPSDPGTPSTTTPTADTTPTWSWAASTDAGAGLAATPYTVDWSQVSDFSSDVETDTASGTSYTHTTDLDEGTWYFRVKAKDALNNESGYSSNGSVLIDTSGPSTPGTPSTTTPTNNTKPAWTWTASSDGGAGLDTNAYTVQWSQDNTFGTGVSSDTATTNTYTHAADLSDGTWYFRVKAADSVGNQSGYSSNGSVLIDTVVPTTPGAPAATASPTNVVRPTINWTASSDADSGMGSPPYSFQYCDASDFTGCGSNVVTTASNNYTYTSDLSAGRHYFRVKAMDAAGNSSSYSSTGHVDIDLTAPSTPGTPSTTTPTASTKPAWTWTASTDTSGLASPAYSVQWSQASDFSSGVSSATAASNSFTHSSDLAAGTWYFRVRATDAAGNNSSYSSNGSVFIDLTAPSTPGTPSTTTPTTDNTPSWSWSASSDGGSGLAATPYTVEWSTHSDFSSGVSSSTSATTSFTHGTPLADGTWYFRVKAADAVGNVSGYSGNGSVQIDTTVPATPGTPTTPSPTNNLQPSWSWSASSDSGVGLANPAYTVEWTETSDFSSGVTSDTTNTNAYDHTSDLSDGTWYFRVKATDALGNVSAWSTAGSVDISTNGPLIPGQPSTTTPTTDKTPTWSWTASSAPSGLASPAYTVEWSQDNTFGTGVSSDTTDAITYTHTVNLADGTWYFRVKAEDQASNFSGYSLLGTVLIDTTAPSTPGTPSTTTPTADTTPTWTWTASSDGGSGLATTPYTVEWSQDNTFGSGVSSTTSATASFTHASALTAGTWYFRVKTADVVGNVSAYSSNGTVVIDTTPPSVPGTPSGTTPTNDTTPTVSWTASTDNVALATMPYIVQWSQDSSFGTGVGDTVAGTSETPSIPLTEGTWYFHVKAVDSVGNQSNYSANGVIVIDTTAPTDPGTPNTPTPTSDTTPTWTWTASTDTVGLPGTPYGLQWSQDNTFGSGVTTGSSSTASFTHGSALAEGTWYFRVRTTDQAGNVSSWSAAASVVIDTTTPTTPGVPNTTTPTANNKPAWTWTASTDNDGLAATPYTLQWSKDNTFGTGVQTATSATNSFTHGSSLSDGTWYMRAKATDNAGNDSAWSAAGTVVVDATPPTTPGTPSTTSPTADNTPAWTWTASSDGSGVGLASPAYTLQWSTDNSFTTGVQTTTTSSASFTHSTPLADGTWYFRVEASDQLSNAVFSSAGSVAIDTTPPVLSAVHANPTATTAAVTWTTNENADSKVEYGLTSSYGSQTSVTDTGPRVTSHSINLSGFVACSTYHYRVISADAVTNQITGSDNTLTTAGCAGQADVVGQSATGIAQADGGTAELLSTGTGVRLDIPAAFAADDANFQIKRLDKTAALVATDVPAGYLLVTTYIYDFHALSDNSTAITSFDHPITVTMTYASGDLAGLDSSTLIIERWDGSSWQTLTGCQNNTGSLNVSCTTTGFSTFGLFAKAAPATSGGSSGSTSSGAPSNKSTTDSSSKASTGSGTSKTETSSDSAGVLNDKTKSAGTPKVNNAIVDKPFLTITKAEALWIGGGALALLLLAFVIKLTRRGGDRDHPHHV